VHYESLTRHKKPMLMKDTDPVHMVASGATSLGRESHLAFRAEDDADDQPDRDDDPRQAHSPPLLDADAEDDDNDGFDLLSDADDTDDDPQHPSADRQDAAELFADIWAEDQDAEIEADTDFFAAKALKPDTNEAPEAMPQTNAEALMQTMYPQKSAVGDDPLTEVSAQPEHSEAIVAQNEGPAEPAAEPKTETHNSSAFQKILRRQSTVSTEDQTTPEPADEVAPPPTAPISVPAPAAGRARRQAGRVKTRLLGFGNDFGGEKDLFAADGTAVQPAQAKFPVGWMVIVSGPGRGTSFTLFNGVSQIGRGEDQAVRLDFGDNSISRSNHAAVAYDPEQQEFFLGHGGKANLVRLNGSPVLSTEPLKNGALIRLGETTLRFVGLCGDDFDWGDTQEGEDENARFG